MKLKDVLPHEFTTGEFDDAPALKLADEEVESRHDSHEKRWPIPQKNVHFLVVLKNGRAVGFNKIPDADGRSPSSTTAASRLHH
jgi:hypothetical protein